MSDTTVNRGIDVFANLVYFWIGMEILAVVLAVCALIYIVRKWF